MHGHPQLYKVTHDGERSDMVILGCVVVCGHGWWGMVVHGHSWLYMVIHGCTWPSMVVTWSCVVIHGNVGLCVVVCGQECPGVLVHGHTLSCMAVNGHTWSHTVTHGVPRGSGDIRSQGSEPTAWSRTQGAASSQLLGAASGTPNTSPGLPRSLSPARTGDRSQGNSASS